MKSFFFIVLLIVVLLIIRKELSRERPLDGISIGTVELSNLDPKRPVDTKRLQSLISDELENAGAKLGEGECSLTGFVHYKPDHEPDTVWYKYPFYVLNVHISVSGCGEGDAPILKLKEPLIGYGFGIGYHTENGYPPGLSSRTYEYVAEEIVKSLIRRVKDRQHTTK